MARILNTLRNIALIAACAGAGPALAGDISNGAKMFKTQCSICHHDTANAAPSVGPDLFGVVGRKAGSLSGFNYSAAMKHSDLTWTPDALKRYLADPQKVVPGNHMPFQGVHDETKLGDLLSFLKTLK